METPLAVIIVGEFGTWINFATLYTGKKMSKLAKETQYNIQQKSRLIDIYHSKGLCKYAKLLDVSFQSVWTITS